MYKVSSDTDVENGSTETGLVDPVSPYSSELIVVTRSRMRATVPSVVYIVG